MFGVLFLGRKSNRARSILKHPRELARLDTENLVLDWVVSYRGSGQGSVRGLEFSARSSETSEVPKLREVFAAMDANGDGNVTMEEIEAVPMDVIPKEFFEKNNVSSMQEIFEVLDVDGGGELSQEEFVDGLLDIFFRDVPLETVQTLKMLRMMECRLQVLKDTVDVVQQKVLAVGPSPAAEDKAGRPSDGFRKLLT